MNTYTTQSLEIFHVLAVLYKHNNEKLIIYCRILWKSCNIKHTSSFKIYLDKYAVSTLGLRALLRKIYLFILH